jgi:hypothetical protein
MSDIKAIRYSFTASMEKLIIPRLVWEQPDHEKGGVVHVELPDEIRDYLMEAAAKADERLEAEVPGGTSVMVKNKWPEIAPIGTKLKRLNLEDEA